MVSTRTTVALAALGLLGSVLWLLVWTPTQALAVGMLCALAFICLAILLSFLPSLTWSSEAFRRLRPGGAAAAGIIAIILAVMQVAPKQSPPADIEWSAELSPGWNSCSGEASGWVFPQQESGLAPPPTDVSQPADLGAWVKDQGGIPSSPITLFVIATAQGGSGIVKSISPVNVKPGPPVHGTHVYVPPDGCGGGGITTVQLSLDLTRAVHGPITPSRDSQGATLFPRVLNPDNPDLYEITVDKAGQDYSFDLNVTWMIGSEEHSTLLDNNGSHFFVAGASASTGFLLRLDDLSSGLKPMPLTTARANGCAVDWHTNGTEPLLIDPSTTTVGCAEAKAILEKYRDLPECGDCGNMNVREVNGWNCYAPTSAAAEEERVSVVCERQGGNITSRTEDQMLTLRH